MPRSMFPNLSSVTWIGWECGGWRSWISERRDWMNDDNADVAADAVTWSGGVNESGIEGYATMMEVGCVRLLNRGRNC